MFVAVGLLYSWGAWLAARRWGVRWLLVAWAFATPLAAVLMVLRIHQRESALGFSPAQQAQLPVFWPFLLMWALGFGLATLGLRARLRAGDPSFLPHALRRSVVGYVGGLLLWALAYALLDIRGVIWHR